MPETGYSELITLIGEIGEMEVEAKADTAADRTSIDMEIAAHIGDGPIVGTKNLSVSRGYSKGILAHIKVRIRGNTYDVDASVDDLTNVTYQFLIGRNILATGKFSVVPPKE